MIDHTVKEQVEQQAKITKEQNNVHYARQCRKVALETALSNKPAHPNYTWGNTVLDRPDYKTEQLLKEADKIYEWLINNKTNV